MINLALLAISTYFLIISDVNNGDNGYDNYDILIYIDGDGTNNQWDFYNIGNYWSDFAGVDVDDNGVGDTPYIITGGSGSQDNYPIWDDGPG
ncbi:MAG: hypothetical protein ACFFA4_12295 [Promethearchaeota archaeon]